MRLAVARHASVRPAAAPVPEPRPGRLILWTVLGSLVPGLGLLRAGRRVLGGVVLGVAVLVVLGGAGLLLAGGPVRVAESVAVSPVKLAWTAAAAAVLAVLWLALVVTTHVALRGPAGLRPLHSAGCALVVVALVAAGAVPALKVAESAVIARQTLFDLFGAGNTSGLRLAQQPTSAAEVPPSTAQGAPDPWAGVPRVNVLLIGSDAGADREGVRPDTMIVASIDTRTGSTVLFSLPRNLQHVPFPPGSPAAAAFPRGFYCVNPANGVNTECLLNGVWQFGEAHAGDYYAGVRNPGLTATIQAAEGVTGLQIGHYVLVDLRGFKEFVDAIGGLTVTVHERLPIGGSVENPAGTTGWIEPGRQKLDGYHALWFARSRWSTDDFDRMRRQRCVIGALAQQADPVTLAANFPAIARAAQRSIQTDVRLDDLDAWVQLARRVQGSAVRSLPFTDDVIDTVNPNFTRVHALVRAALEEPSSSSSSSPSPSVTPSPSPSGSSAKRSGHRSAPGTDAADVRSVC